jgi:hypothetical protein
MTGASRADWLRYRALWFSLLNQGFLRAGTANSDSHSLAIERIGYPRNLIWGNHDKTNLDADGYAAFNSDVKAGHLEGTNGPVLDVTIDDGTGKIYRPGLTPFSVMPAAATLNVTVTAAPWIPVDELRIFVNGKQVMVPVGGTLVPSVDISSSFSGADHLGTVPSRYPMLPAPAASFPLAALLPTTGDAWIVVEAGMTQVTPPDTDGDGLPDLPDAGVPVRPPEGDERFDVEAIAPGVWPTAFSNPFLLDLDGGGWTAPGLP